MPKSARSPTPSPKPQHRRRPRNLRPAEARRLLAARSAELAMFAAWAVHDQRRRDARRVVREAVEAVGVVSDPALRDKLARAMISMLVEPLLAVIREMLMNTVVIPESPGFKAIREELKARGLPVDATTRERIDQCRDTTALTRWIARAVTASSVAEVLGD